MDGKNWKKIHLNNSIFQNPQKKSIKDQPSYLKIAVKIVKTRSQNDAAWNRDDICRNRHLISMFIGIPCIKSIILMVQAKGVD